VKVGLTINIGDALADLATIDQAVPAQMQVIIARASAQYASTSQARTPVGTEKKRAGQRLSTGWQTRQISPLKVYVANIRPHAHLAAEGWTHVGGKHIAPFVPWIPDAVHIRERMVDDIEDLVQGSFPTTLRALRVTP
jgi:hypothetical protein